MAFGKQVITAVVANLSKIFNWIHFINDRPIIFGSISNAADQEVMSNDSAIPVQLLQINQKSFTLRLRALRVGFPVACGTKFASRIQKMIMMNHEVSLATDLLTSIIASN